MRSPELLDLTGTNAIVPGGGSDSDGIFAQGLAEAGANLMLRPPATSTSSFAIDASLNIVSAGARLRR
jgi:hypothetical protein